MTEHAVLAPSGAYQWAPDEGCRAAVQMQVRYPENKESDKAREGTAAHWHVTETLLRRAAPAGSIAPNGVPIDDEMVDCGKEFLEVVWRCWSHHPQTSLRVEQRVVMTSIHPDQCWGTPDVYLIDVKTRILYVWDYKYGHRYVDVHRNWQLLLYAIGILNSEGVPSSDWSHWSIRLWIGQPRSFTPNGTMREWEIGGAVLLKYVEPLRRAAIEALMPGAMLQTGNHCRDCTARHACPALMQSAALSVDVAYEQTPMDLTPHALGLELRYLREAEKRLSARADALEEVALGLIRGGRDVPLWKADYSKGRERWTRPAEEVAMVGDMFGVNLLKPPECITPAQARKAGIDGTVIAPYIEQPVGALKLVAVTDNSVAKAFGAD